MRSRTTRRVAAVTAASALALGFAGCGGGGGASGKGSASSAALRIAWASTPTQLDPNEFTGLTWVYGLDGFMETLLDYDTSKAADGKVLGVDALKPALAESFEANEDKTQYTFKLRQGVKSEWGNELDADDVIWSFERMFTNPRSLQAGVLLPTANVDKQEPWTKVDQYTVRYNLTDPSAVSLSVLAYPILGIVDSDEAKKHATKDDPWAAEWLKTNSASFGAYKLKSLDPGRELRLEYNSNYWGPRPAFEEIVIKAVPDASSRAQLLISGDVDMISEPPIDQLKKIDESANAAVSRQPDSNRHNLSVNVKDPALGKPKVRQAISHAINREAIVNSIYQGYAQSALSPQASALLADQPKTGSYDPDRAKQLLAEAGHPNGFDMTVAFNTARPGPFAENLGRLIQSDLQKVGINVNLKAIPSAADFEAAVSKQEYQAYLYSERPSQPDPGFSLFLYLYSESALNKSGYNNPEFDRLVTTVLKQPSGPQREQVVNQAIEFLVGEEPIISLVEVPDLVGVAENVKGYVALPTGGVKFDELKRS
ncbi:ABC transporter substrate-binding protein [Micromonospora qiuiae]|uniref:ABC transporter substrate-binding protein n=1 Tax=Micromonospora qiuiae TaxID=502268 RepID=A0ABQ4JGV4_9ACTN|nr:ABC transporter substrate-binding protein [Micromonospora qiuiae]GIJ29866.1 ABC transporter substrate-binding protein [Micromonospora qiuiae]